MARHSLHRPQCRVPARHLRQEEDRRENRKARFEYSIDTVYEAGIALTGTEVKSLRFGEGSIGESYAEVRDGQVWLVNANVPEFSHGNRFNHEASVRVNCCFTNAR